MRHGLSRVADAAYRAVRRRGSGWAEAVVPEDFGEALLARVRTDHPPGGEDADDPALTRLGRIFGLAALDLDLLAVAAAPDLDVGLGQLIGILAGLAAPGFATVGAALEVLDRRPDDPDARARLRRSAPLLVHGLLDVTGGGPLPTRRMAVPERVLAHLLGDDTPEPTFDPLLVQAPAITSDTATRLGRGLLAGNSLAHVIEAPGTGGLSTAAAAFASIGVAAVLVDLSHRGGEQGWVAAAAESSREAGLLGAGLVVTGLDAAGAALPELLAVLSRAPVPVIVVDRLRWAPDVTPVAPLTVAAPALDRAARALLWRSVVPENVSSAAGFDDVVNLAMTAPDIVRTAQVAVSTAAADDVPLDLAALRVAARDATGALLAESAHRIVPQVTLADVIVPGPTGAALRELVSWARHREELLGRAGLGGRGSKSSGVLSLFAGSPGTGKTLAAEAIAGELGLELYTVELSSVVDKYIGETEKNLERIIREAEALNVVLFFDEADAIFGQRSAVRDARDRYANQEVSYLLQRMERFSGLAVLATNLRGNLDPAFSRRLHFIVSFPDPPPDIRARLWHAHLAAVPRLDPDDPVDVDRLAGAIELSGAEIRNIVMAAAFAATGAEVGVGMRHLIVAAERELAKLGRRVPAALTGAVQ